MSSLARAKHPKVILDMVGTAIAIPVLGITISFVSVSANAQQDPGVQQNTSAQQEATGAVANVSTLVASPASTNSPTEIADPKPTQSLLPDPLVPSASSSPAPEAVTAPTPVASAEPSVKETPRATPSPISTVKASTPTDAQDVQAPRVVKKTTEIARSWTPPFERDIVKTCGWVSLGDLGFGLGVVGSFDEFAFAQCRTGADERNEVGCVDSPPPALGGFDELERHDDPGCP